jgi:predicted AAA+ superfamily ATPase
VLAYQIGSLVNYSEIGVTIGLDEKTVQKYVDLLQKLFVIFRVRPYSRNMRNEIKASHKIYFYDLGIRNSIISNWEDIDTREDAGHMFENFVVSEMMKKSNWKKYYFWRNKKQQEIDLIEEHNGRLNAYEIKLSPKADARIPNYFITKYQPNSAKIINSANYDELLLLEFYRTISD